MAWRADGSAKATVTRALPDTLEVSVEEWKQELELIADHYEALGERLPAEMNHQLEQLRDRLANV